MAGTLQSRLGVLALEFSESVLEAIRGASLEELFGESVARGAPAVPRAARAVRTAPAASAGRPPAPAPTATAATSRGRKPRPGRLSRRSPSDIERVISEIVSLLTESPGGMRAEEIRRRLGLVAKELPRPLKEGLDSGRIGKSGQKRATTYFIAGAAGAGAKAPAAGGRKAVRAVVKRKAAPGKAKAQKSAARKRGASKRGARPSAKARKPSKPARPAKPTK